MNVEYSKAFAKAVKKLSGKMLDSVKRTILETKRAENIGHLNNCEKLIGYKNIYRLRIGDLRAFFFLRVEVGGDTVIFEYLVPRGQA
ncbi:MAG: type II toxin-antitoxin system RelE family toxin, partial [Mariniphaga sp.]